MTGWAREQNCFVEKVVAVVLITIYDVGRRDGSGGEAEGGGGDLNRERGSGSPQRRDRNVGIIMNSTGYSQNLYFILLKEDTP